MEEKDGSQQQSPVRWPEMCGGQFKQLCTQSCGGGKVRRPLEAISMENDAYDGQGMDWHGHLESYSVDG